MQDETTSLPYLLSGSTLILILAAFYVGRSLWIARREWPQCSTDTKVLYLLVAPILTLAVDVLEITDRLFWSSRKGKPQVSKRMAKAPLGVMPLRPKSALRSES